jgi:hypothetical protein
MILKNEIEPPRRIIQSQQEIVKKENPSKLPRLLFVNDEAFVVMAYFNQLSKYFSVTTAENGLKAVNLVKAHPRNHF